MAKKYIVTLTTDERSSLLSLLSLGKGSTRKLTHARILLKAAQGAEGPGWTDEQISQAVRGPDGRAYPWGDVFDPRRANTREAGIGETTPVGVFPDGASPYGALDMAGNVEECTSSLYRLYPGSPVQDPEQGSYLVTRGGCFALDGDLARCDRRHGLPFAPAAGFRLARSRASAELAPEAGENQ